MDNLLSVSTVIQRFMAIWFGFGGFIRNRTVFMNIVNRFGVPEKMRQSTQGLKHKTHKIPGTMVKYEEIRMKQTREKLIGNLQTIQKKT